MAPSVTQSELISGAELARRAGVTAQSISTAIRGKLKSATVGRQILAAHPLITSYIAKHAGRPKHVKRTVGRPRLKEGPPPAYNPLYPQTQVTDARASAPDTAAAEDPVALACELTQSPPVPEHAARRQYTNAVLFNLQTQTAGQLPSDLDDLGRMSLREAVDRCGSFEALQALTKALKVWADYVKADVDAKRKRGTLVERAAVERTVFPYIDLTQRRALEEVPKAVSQQIIARVLAGGDDLAIDVEKLIHDALASVYRACKTTTVATLGG